MKLTHVALSLAVACAFAAAQDPVKPAADKPSPKAESQPARKLGLAKPLVMEKDREVYGAELTLKESTKLADILAEPKKFEGKTVKVNAEIEGVCLKKGCWMNVKDGAQKATVKFKDYKFFVPLDVDGRVVAFEAVPQVKVITEAMRRHYAEDAGLPKEEILKIVGDETKVVFMAEAVEIGGKPAKDDCCEGEVEADGSIRKDAPAEKKSDDGKKPAEKKEGAAGEKKGCCGDAKPGEAKKTGGCCGKDG
ncbi:MAG TPA: DUF4920 domain-containing protein [Planctomycetota bacterium]|nr:DUF4920 domain-containing protein [Planctomycetota bacterium]